jgi:hypothetical protein
MPIISLQLRLAIPHQRIAHGMSAILQPTCVPSFENRLYSAKLDIVPIVKRFGRYLQNLNFTGFNQDQILLLRIAIVTH